MELVSNAQNIKELRANIENTALQITVTSWKEFYRTVNVNNVKSMDILQLIKEESVYLITAEKVSMLILLVDAYIAHTLQSHLH